MKKYKGAAFKTYLFFVLVLLTGVFIGALTAGILSAEKCADAVIPFENRGITSYGIVFRKSFLQWIKPVLFMWISGFFGFSIYSNMVAVIYKGAVLGAAAGAFLKTYGAGKGMLLSLCGILPQYPLHSGDGHYRKRRQNKHEGNDRLGFKCKIQHPENRRQF